MDNDRIPNFSSNTNPFMPYLDSKGNYKKDNNMSNVNFMQVVPNSHFWGDLKGIINSIDFYIESEKRKQLPKKPNVYYGKSEMSKEHLLIGLDNCKKHGYKLKRFSEPEGSFIAPHFITIDQIIEWVQNCSFTIINEYVELQDYLRNTMANGFNLTNGMKMQRSDVYKRLDGERDYQDARWGTRRTLDGTPDEEKPVAEWINYMEFHLAKAKEKVYYLKTEEALAEVRKVAALGVRAMEIHGCPERVISPEQEISIALDDTKSDSKPCCDDNCNSKKE